MLVTIPVKTDKTHTEYKLSVYFGVGFTTHICTFLDWLYSTMTTLEGDNRTMEGRVLSEISQ